MMFLKLNQHVALKLNNMIKILLGLLAIINQGWAVSPVYKNYVLVRGHRSYADLSPERFDTPVGLDYLSFTFDTQRLHRSCPDREFQIVLRQGGLPFVNGSASSFPDNFVLTQEPTIRLALKSQQRIEVTLKQPPPGPWFVIAYFDEVDSSIKQKGLTPANECYYFFSSRLTHSGLSGVATIYPNQDIEAKIDNVSGMVYFSFTVSPETVGYDVHLLECDPSPCNLKIDTITFNRQMKFRQKFDCQNVNNTSVRADEDCVLHVSSPLLSDRQLLRFQSEESVLNGSTFENQSFVFKVTLQECTTQADSSTLTVPNCYVYPPLGRIQNGAMMTLLTWSMRMYISVELSNAGVVAIPFQVQDPDDVGATLKWLLHMGHFEQGNVTKLVKICAGLMYDQLPDTSRLNYDLCGDDLHGLINHSIYYSQGVRPKIKTFRQYVPYPQAGLWHLVLQAACYTQQGNKTNCSETEAFVEILLEFEPCVNGGCSGNGQCELKTGSTDLISFYSCQCLADYKGYGCTDSSEAQSVSTQLTSAYLLTFSNFFFLPAIIVSLQRGFILEAFVYAFTMFFSTFYHACDGNRLVEYKLCISKYEVLQLSDFFGSACSLWFTVVAMGRIRYKQLVSLLQICGTFGLFIGVVYDPHSLAVIAVPIFTGLTIIIVSWGIRMYQRKQLYPSWKRYIFYLVPGVTLALVGGSCFAFLETEENYKYIHSVWHACVALSIGLLLPPYSGAGKLNKCEAGEPTFPVSQTTGLHVDQENTENAP